MKSETWDGIEGIGHPGRMFLRCKEIPQQMHYLHLFSVTLSFFDPLHIWMTAKSDLQVKI